jgi:hypothetical protein
VRSTSRRTKPWTVFRLNQKGRLIIKKLMSMMAFIVFASTANAETIGYNFEWTGSDGYSMTGMFTYDEINAVDGAIRDGAERV